MCRPLAEAATISVPRKANATPIEQIIRYFHIASSDAGLTGMQIRNAVKSVVASIPTHMMPRLLEINDKRHRRQARRTTVPQTDAGLAA